MPTPKQDELARKIAGDEHWRAPAIESALAPLYAELRAKTEALEDIAGYIDEWGENENGENMRARAKSALGERR